MQDFIGISVMENFIFRNSINKQLLNLEFITINIFFLFFLTFCIGSATIFNTQRSSKSGGDYENTCIALNQSDASTELYITTKQQLNLTHRIKIHKFLISMLGDVIPESESTDILQKSKGLVF